MLSHDRATVLMLQPKLYRLSSQLYSTKTIKEIHMFTLLILAAVVLGFLSGSIWLFSVAVSALMVKMFPILLVAIAIGGGALLAFKHYIGK